VATDRHPRGAAGLALGVQLSPDPTVVANCFSLLLLLEALCGHIVIFALLHQVYFLSDEKSHVIALAVHFFWRCIGILCNCSSALRDSDGRVCVYCIANGFHLVELGDQDSSAS